MKRNRWFQKFTEWEYWPSYMFYGPNFPYALYLILKARNLTFFSTVNPGIYNSGNGTESKYKTLELIPKEYKPKSIFVSKNRTFEKVQSKLKNKNISYPIIAKPDIGFRGLLVKKITSDTELNLYLKKFPIDIILQEFIELPNECGIFYIRKPNEERGHISSLTVKAFLKVKGDGVSTLSELVLYDNRAKHYYNLLEEIHKDTWDIILEKDLEYLLSDIGNHAKGTQFINANHLIDDNLTEVIDVFSKRIKGWYYGRMDVKYNTIDELKNGKNFIVLEINGTISEPTHIYDPYRTTYLKGLHAIRKHWDKLYDIAMINMKNGIKPVPFRNFWSDLRDLMRYIKKVKHLAKTNS